MTILHSFLLGIIQGLTEFIPVSSTAHLLIAQGLFKIPADDAMFSFLVIVQLGTIVSLIDTFGMIAEPRKLRQRNMGHGQPSRPPRPCLRN